MCLVGTVLFVMILAVTAGGSLAFDLWKSREERRFGPRAAWACRGCRYDLRGLEAGTCPECGWTLDVATRAAIERARRVDATW